MNTRVVMMMVRNMLQRNLAYTLLCLFLYGVPALFAIAWWVVTSPVWIPVYAYFWVKGKRQARKFSAVPRVEL